MFTDGQAIEKRRNELGFTKRRMAEVLDISEFKIELYEKGTRIKKEDIEEISWFLHCKVSDIAYERA